MQPPGDLEGGGGLRRIRFARRVQVAEDHRVVGEVIGFGQYARQRRIQRRALISQFLQIVSPSEWNVMECKEGLSRLFSRLLAVEHGPRWFLAG